MDESITPFNLTKTPGRQVRDWKSIFLLLYCANSDFEMTGKKKLVTEKAVKSFYGVGRVQRRMLRDEEKMPSMIEKSLSAWPRRLP
ncbi:hypothetical protein NC652_019210 [Populus alba x Populus x berolinensis]|nr:hypothetical protein NC652_019210 [Populus alba x Populus x berolinensis]